MQADILSLIIFDVYPDLGTVTYGLALQRLYLCPNQVIGSAGRNTLCELAAAIGYVLPSLAGFGALHARDLDVHSPKREIAWAVDSAKDQRVRLALFLRERRRHEHHHEKQRPCQCHLTNSRHLPFLRPSIPRLPLPRFSVS